MQFESFLGLFLEEKVSSVALQSNNFVDIIEVN